MCKNEERRDEEIIIKRALFVILDQYADWEGAYLSSVLNQDKDWQVKTASTKKKVSSIGGFHTEMDFLLHEITKNPDLLVLIGGNSWSIDDSDLENLVSYQLENGKILAAICGAVDYLARIGQLNAHKHTGNVSFLWADFKKYQNLKNFVEEEAVSDRNLITANGTGVLDFTTLTLEALGFSKKKVQQVVEMHRVGYYQYSQKYGNPYV